MPMKPASTAPVSERSGHASDRCRRVARTHPRRPPRAIRAGHGGRSVSRRSRARCSLWRRCCRAVGQPQAVCWSDHGGRSWTNHKVDIVAVGRRLVPLVETLVEVLQVIPQGSRGQRIVVDHTQRLTEGVATLPHLRSRAPQGLTHVRARRQRRLDPRPERRPDHGTPAPALRRQSRSGRHDIDGPPAADVPGARSGPSCTPL